MTAPQQGTVMRAVLVVKLKEIYDYIEHDLILELMRSSRPMELKTLPCHEYAKVSPCSLRKNAAGVQADRTAYRLMANSAACLEKLRAGSCMEIGKRR